MTHSTVPDASADPAADVASPTRPGPTSIVTAPPLNTPADAGIDGTAPLRTAVHALTMHATIHTGIADWERGLHDGSPPPPSPTNSERATPRGTPATTPLTARDVIGYTIGGTGSTRRQIAAIILQALFAYLCKRPPGTVGQ